MKFDVSQTRVIINRLAFARTRIFRTVLGIFFTTCIQQLKIVCFFFTELDPAELYVPVDPNKIPKFLTKPTKFDIVTKDTVVLPCEVYNPGEFILVSSKREF